MIKKFFSRIKKNTELNRKEGENKDVISNDKIKICKEDEINKKNNEEINERIDEEVLVKKEDKNEDEFILNAKIRREKEIKSIDLYTGEEQFFKTHKECSRKLKIPQEYIVENLKFEYIDYLGEAIKYLSEELKVNDSYHYLESEKCSLEQFNNLHNKIFTSKISENKREKILSNEKIEPIKMHYKFESIDYEFDEYFEKYKSIIKRGN